ncbi:MAG: ribbon-helix-helix protein, CopG family [Erysipelothrix sp.]|nr:ribbon-helix-helix protein, CopG family [Erysipelothrix sp.]
MSIINVRMNEKEKELIKKFAETRGSSMSDVMKQAVFSLIEDEIDLDIYNQAILRENEKTYTHNQILKELEIE